MRGRSKRMRLNGINTFTLVDYPGKIAAVVFTAGCNFRCGYCHNRQFVDPLLLKKEEGNIIPLDAFFHFLSTRKGLLDGISICGGEPTIHSDLPEFITQIKSHGFLVKLDTNGTNPDMLSFLLEKNLLDFVAMDLKHQSPSLDTLVESCVNKEVLEKSKQLIMERAPDYEFRTTVIKGWHQSSDIEAIAR